jgi:aldehyde:ferredoxin oxidoreductase
MTEWLYIGDGRGGVPRMAEVLSALTGVDFSAERLHEACDRVYNIERAYLVKNGIRREDDVPPRHFTELPIQDGPSKGKTVDMDKFEELKDLWYDLRGQDRKTGAPKRGTLEELGLKYVADELEKTGVYKG